ncbi:unnamed protein product, partial [Owenia fusiformis]
MTRLTLIHEIRIGITLMGLSVFHFALVRAAPTDNEFKQLSNTVIELQRDVRDQAIEIAVLERNAIKMEILVEQLRKKCSKTCTVKKVKGPPGKKGAQGPTGEIGPQGVKGDKGLTGATGPQGPKGNQGHIGATGSQGPKGAQGDRGSTGTSGSQGPKGDQGPIGTTGPQGPKGDRGPIGATGSQGQNGAKGDRGPTGPKGDKGSAGALGPKGQQGAKGDRGPTGAAGLAGNTGPKGQQGQKGERGSVADSCQWTDWSAWSSGPCSKSCNNGTRLLTRTRNYTQCVSGTVTETRPVSCNTQICREIVGSGTASSLQKALAHARAQAAKEEYHGKRIGPDECNPNTVRYQYDYDHSDYEQNDCYYYECTGAKKLERRRCPDGMGVNDLFKMKWNDYGWGQTYDPCTKRNPG